MSRAGTGSTPPTAATPPRASTCTSSWSTAIPRACGRCCSSGEIACHPERSERIWARSAQIPSYLESRALLAHAPAPLPPAGRSFVASLHRMTIRSTLRSELPDNYGLIADNCPLATVLQPGPVDECASAARGSRLAPKPGRVSHRRMVGAAPCWASPRRTLSQSRTRRGRGAALARLDHHLTALRRQRRRYP